MLLTKDEFKTGDLLMSLYVDPKMSLYDHILVDGIRSTTGSKHNHDELLCRMPDGLYVGYATPPHFELVPFSVREQEFMDGKRVFAIFRHKTFMKPGHSMYHEAFQDCAAASIKTMAALEVQYNWSGVGKILAMNIVRNLLRRTIKLNNVEHDVYCTQSCVVAYRVNGIDIMAELGKQEFPSPVHMERLYKSGTFELIADYGLMARIGSQKKEAPAITASASLGLLR